MEPTLTHDQLQELLAVFALHALDPAEADAVNAHLENCPRCRDEVAQHQQAAALLASTGGDAPPRVWDAIATKIERPNRPETAKPPRLDRPRMPGGRAHKRSRLAVGAAAIAAVAVAAIALLGVEVGRLDHRLNHASATHATATISSAATSALLDPAGRRLVLAATNSKTTGAAAEVVVEPSGAAFLFNRQLTALPDSQTYQLWHMSDGRAVSIGLLGPHPGIAAFNLNPAHPTGVLAVTIEPAGGSVAPTRRPIATGS